MAEALPRRGLLAAPLLAIATSGIGPIQHHLTDPSQPGWRKV